MRFRTAIAAAALAVAPAKADPRYPDGGGAHEGQHLELA